MNTAINLISTRRLEIPLNCIIIHVVMISKLIMNDPLVWHSMFQLQVSGNCLIAGFFHKNIVSPFADCSSQTPVPFIYVCGGNTWDSSLGHVYVLHVNEMFWLWWVSWDCRPGPCIFSSTEIHKYDLWNTRWAKSKFLNSSPISKNHGCWTSLIPRPFPPPVFDHLQYAKTEGEGLGERVTCMMSR